MFKKLKVRRGCTVPRTQTWPCNGTEELATTGSVDGCSALLETQFVGSHLSVDTTQPMSVGGLPPMEAAGERSELDIKPPLGLHS